LELNDDLQGCKPMLVTEKGLGHACFKSPYLLLATAGGAAPKTVGLFRGRARPASRAVLASGEGMP